VATTPLSEPAAATDDVSAAAAATPTATVHPGNAAFLADMIRVEQPQPGDTVTSPLEVRGEARGSWFFEASFPLAIMAANMQPAQQRSWLGTAVATALDDWMTTDFVPFEATLEFTAPGPDVIDGYLVLDRDNPSGLPEHDAQLVIPVRFAPPATP
jgi:hypothetical protein